MAKKLTHEKFLEKFYEKNSNAENIEVLEKYQGSKTHIKCKCKIDNYIWKVTPDSLLNGNSGCPMCAIKSRNDILRKTHEQFIKELEKINPNIEVLEEYVTNDTYIKCKCKIDNHIWKVTPHNLLNCNGCPMCYNNYRGDSLKKTHEQFVKELEEINSDIEVLEEYKGALTKIKCRCKIDNHIWKVRPHDLLQGQGCPICSSSKGEKRIVKYLNNNNIEFIPQMFYSDLRGINNGLLTYDFYLPKYNLLIEYQGEYHDHTVSNQSDFDFAKQQEHDRRKKEYAIDNGIELLEIWYQDFDNIEIILDEILN